jgi:hypothetical protein
MRDKSVTDSDKSGTDTPQLRLFFAQAFGCKRAVPIMHLTEVTGWNAVEGVTWGATILPPLGCVSDKLVMPALSSMSCPVETCAKTTWSVHEYQFLRKRAYARICTLSVLHSQNQQRRVSWQQGKCEGAQKRAS